MLGKRCTTLILLIPGFCVLGPGCSRTQVQSVGMSDPLIVSNQPVEGTIMTASAKRHRTEYPAPPHEPNGLWNVVRKTNPVKLLSSDDLSPSLVWATKKQATPTKIDHSFKAAKDYHWLQGKLEHVSPRYSLLRFAEESSHDPWGGKVCLEPHPSLKTVQKEDLIYVEGQLLMKNDQPLFGHWCPYPRYRIEKLLILRRED